MSTCPKRLDTALQTVRFSLSAHAKCWVMSERALFSAKSGWARCPARLLVVLVQSPHSPCFRHAKVKGYFPYTQEFGVFFFHRFSCCIGFRHEGLFAADVERLNEESQNSGVLNEEIVDSVEIVEELGEDANIGQQILEESKKEPSVPLYKLESETKRNEFKVIKKIQLEEKDLKRKRW